MSIFYLICVCLTTHNNLINKIYSSVDGGAYGGVCHTFIIIETDSSTFILERLVEGVRLSMVTNTDLVTTNSMLILQYNHITKPFSSKQIAFWIKKKSIKQYGLFTNNCIHFAYQFGSKFTDHPLFKIGILKFAKKALSTLNLWSAEVITLLIMGTDASLAAYQ